MQPKEEGATLATDTEMGRAAEIEAGGTPCEIHSPKQSLCLAISCGCTGAGCDKKWISHNVHLHDILQWMGIVDV